MLERARQSLTGGVSSPFRAKFPVPLYFKDARGPRAIDVDGNEYIDYIGTWGPAIHGHAHPRIIEAIRTAADRGTSFGIPNPLEVKMASLIREAVSSVEKVRMCNSGTEACMAAIRLARGYTERNKIIKFEGCYHGHVDSLLVNAGSGALTFGHPDSAGVPAAFTQHTVVVRFNDIEAVKAAFLANSNDIAAVILEPVPGNAGLYLPKPGFLTFLREITREEGAILIFDEVMTGFRLARGGAQERFRVQPDLSCFGKIIGGGLPVGAFGGRREIMDCLAPLGPVYQAGTLSGNPLAMAAGIAALEMLGPETYNTLEKLGAQLEEGMREAARAAGVPVQFLRCGSMFCCYFTDLPVHDLADAMKSDRDRFARYFHGMLDGGISLAPSQFEAGFLCTAHTPADIERTVEAAARALRELN